MIAENTWFVAAITKSMGARLKVQKPSTEIGQQVLASRHGWFVITTLHLQVCGVHETATVGVHDTARRGLRAERGAAAPRAAAAPRFRRTPLCTAPAHL